MILDFLCKLLYNTITKFIEGDYMQNIKGYSFTNGISFSNHDFETKVTISKENNIEINNLNSNKISSFQKKFIIIYLVSSIFIFLFSIFYIKNILIIISFIWYCLYSHTSTLALIINIFIGIIKPDYKRFHGAEHKVLNYYKVNKKIPKIEELSTYSRFSSTCGSIEQTFKSTYGIIFLYISLKFLETNLILAIGLMCITFICCYILYILNVFAFTQVFITSKPSKKHLQVAIIAFENHLNNNR